MPGFFLSSPPFAPVSPLPLADHDAPPWQLRVGARGGGGGPARVPPRVAQPSGSSETAGGGARPSKSGGLPPSTIEPPRAPGRPAPAAPPPKLTTVRRAYSPSPTSRARNKNATSSRLIRRSTFFNGTSATGLTRAGAKFNTPLTPAATNCS
jgi:hypothetical protein